MVNGGRTDAQRLQLMKEQQREWATYYCDSATDVQRQQLVMEQNNTDVCVVLWMMNKRR